MDTCPEVPDPPPGSDGEAGIRHFAERVARGPDRQAAVNLLKGWLTDQVVAGADPGDYGALHWVWAELEDVADAYDDEVTFEREAATAAEEWLSAHAHSESRRAWVDRWTRWLHNYGSAHTVYWMRPGFAPKARVWQVEVFPVAPERWIAVVEADLGPFSTETTRPEDVEAAVRDVIRDRMGAVEPVVELRDSARSPWTLQIAAEQLRALGHEPR